MQKRKSASKMFQEQQEMKMEEEMDIDMPEEGEAINDEIMSEPMQQVQQSFSQDSFNGLLSSENAKIMPKPNVQKKNRFMKMPISNSPSSEDLQLEKEPMKVRVTGKWFWKKVIVPPNAYVVHTRINRKKPVTLGMGISFKYNPDTDAYLIIPAAMQTIGVVANCISSEKQGINVLAYVQWQIDDFSVAYKKLDLTNTRDPLGIVNAQLGEQAEAAIKDKIATMSVEEVLTDKEPIIEELTSRLKLVAEGQVKGNETVKEGLGIKIITVQIREAFVSSTSLWTDLQSPFRYEQQKKAKLSYLDMINEIKKKELETRKKTETRQAETELELEKIKQKKNTEALELKLKEDEIRYSKEQDTTQNKLKMEEQTLLSKKNMEDRMLAKENEIILNREIEKLKQAEKKAQEEARIKFEAEKKNAELEIEKKLFDISLDDRLEKTMHDIRQKQIEMEKIIKEKDAELKLLEQEYKEKIDKAVLKAKLDQEFAEHKSKIAIEEERSKLYYTNEERSVKIEKIRQEIRNLINDKELFNQLIKQLPKIASELPEIKEMKVLQTGENDYVVDSLINFFTKIFSAAETLGIKKTIENIKKTKQDEK